MKHISDRISFNDRDSVTTTILITPDRKKKSDIFLYLWTAAFTAMGIMIITQFWGDYDDNAKMMFFIYLGFWTYFEFMAIKALVWKLTGKEFIKFHQGEMSIKRSYAGYGKAKKYFVSNISKFGQITQNDKSFKQFFENVYWVVGGEKLGFEYMDKKVIFGLKLEEKELKVLAQIIDKRIKQHAKINN